VKFPGEAAERIARSLQVQGPATVAELGARMGMTAAGIRRPLSALAEAEFVVATERAPFGPAPAPRRGRPSLVYSLTPTGRGALTDDSDLLAIDVLRFLQRTAGDQAVKEFARERAERLISTLQLDPLSPVESLALTLTAAGYAATVEEDNGTTVQLCQHHCPVVDAATEFPALCEAETAALSAALGTHVLRLATLAHGDGVCTSVIPVNRTHNRKVSA
jgi:predicted ArsR family transcriptional regulator